MKYKVEVTRSDGWWAITFPDNPGVFSQARRLDQVPAMAADALSLWNEATAHPEDVAIVAAHFGNDYVEAAVAAAVESQENFRAAQEHMAYAMRRAARQAVEAGLSVRDVGQLLGVSFQRAAVLARDDRHHTPS